MGPQSRTVPPSPHRGALMAYEDEIEITFAMEEAGIEAFLENYPDTGAGDFLDRRMVREIFAAMAKVRAGSNKAGLVHSAQ
jgi:hypothetical protein